MVRVGGGFAGPSPRLRPGGIFDQPKARLFERNAPREEIQRSVARSFRGCPALVCGPSLPSRWAYRVRLRLRRHANNAPPASRSAIVEGSGTAVTLKVPPVSAVSGPWPAVVPLKKTSFGEAICGPSWSRVEPGVCVMEAAQSRGPHGVVAINQLKTSCVSGAGVAHVPDKMGIEVELVRSIVIVFQVTRNDENVEVVASYWNEPVALGLPPVKLM
jgi:hypothetical protein